MFVLAKTSVTCILFMIYMIAFYYRKPHIPVKSTRIFQWLIIAAVLDSTFDLITICTVNNLDTVPEAVNLIAHIIYLMSILFFIYLLFLYLRSYLEIHLRFTRTVKILQSLPLLFSTVGIFILPITYVQGMTTNYSLGPKAYALYVSLVIYLILILYYCLRYWKILEGDKRLAIILAVPLFVVTSIIQMMIPEILAVVICSTLILLGLILSNENTEKYVDEKTMLFNQYAFEEVLEEFDFDKQRLTIAVICFCKTGNTPDWKQDVVFLNDIYKEIKQYHLHGYRVCENGVVFISNAEDKSRADKLQTILEKVRSIIEGRYGKDVVSIDTKILTDDLTLTKHSCMKNIIAVCTEAGSRLAYVDYLTNIYNRNALERDLDKQKENNDIYYITADLNNLKIVNDTIGHSAGDKLLQNFARLLSDTVGDYGSAYRQGGDEFAVLYGKDAVHFIKNLEESCQSYNKFSAVQISYGIGYCKLENKNFRDEADKMMYADKRRKKGQSERRR